MLPNVAQCCPVMLYVVQKKTETPNVNELADWGGTVEGWEDLVFTQFH